MLLPLLVTVTGGHWSLSSVLPTLDSHVATLHEPALSEHLSVGRSWSKYSFCFGLWAAAPPKQVRVVTTLECDRHSSRSFPCCAWLCASWSAALLDADMRILIDRSACLVEPVVVERVLFSSLPCSCKPAPNTSSAASGRCSRISPSRGLVKGLVLLRAAPVTSLRLYQSSGSRPDWSSADLSPVARWQTLCWTFRRHLSHLVSTRESMLRSVCWPSPPQPY